MGVVLAALLVMGPGDTVQIPQCDARPAQAARLDQVHEHQVGWRLLPSGVLMELWGSEAGTWTLLETTPSGIACILQTGEGAVLRWHRA